MKEKRGTLHFPIPYPNKEVQELGHTKEIEPTHLYKLGNSQSKKKILVSMRDTGETNNLAPIIQSLIDDGRFSVSVFADGPGARTLENRFDVKTEESEDILVHLANEMFDSKLVLISGSTDLGISMALTVDANVNGVPVMAVEDFPGVLCDPHRLNEEEGNPLRSPTFYCVMNIWSKENLLENKPNTNPANIIITGIPSFSDVTPENKIPARNKFRERHRLEDEVKLILWVGQVGEGDSETFLLFLKGLRESAMNNYKLVVRRHPRDERSGKFFQNALEGFEILDTTDDSIDDVRRASDLVVSILSTETIKSVCEETPTVLILVPEMLKKSGYDDVGIPIANDGSALVIREENSTVVAETIQKVLNDVETTQVLVNNMIRWKGRPDATRNVVHSIKQKVGI